MRKYIFCLCIALLCAGNSNAQPDLSYYLPEGVTYNPEIPTPKSIIGHEVGEWHVTHDRLTNYMYALDKASDRISLEVTGYTYEARPLLLLTITSPENHQNLESIRTQHTQLTDSKRSSTLNVANMPVVFYVGFSIHGNEASGVNAALLAAYHLAAAQGDEIEKDLKNTIILFDPCYNPDGMQRFSSWVNSRKSMVISTDPLDNEHNEPWPGGRFNHYWFDLNRDWMVAQHPESQARIKSFQKWKPNILTDHHEMGTNATFFFQPGIPSRVHPLTPQRNIELTKRMGEFHAKALDELGSLYYTQESYDDFYYGKGSTYPDVQGAVGILFEQASSRGHAQESVNGVLRFPFTVRNQFTTVLSTLNAIRAMRVDFLNHQRQFYNDMASEAAKDPIKAYLIGSRDQFRSYKLAELLMAHEIEVYKLKSRTTINGKDFDNESSYVIPTAQRQYKLIKSMFERRTQFTDSLFYDISSWTLPLAFGLENEELKNTSLVGERLTVKDPPIGKFNGRAQYAYAFESTGYLSPRAIYRLLNNNIRIKVATKAFHNADGKRFGEGSIIIPLSEQDKSIQQIEYILNEIATKDGVDIHTFNTGLDYKGVSLGSGSFLTLKKPEIAMLVGDGFSATDAGEIWHMLDTRFSIPVTLIPVEVFNSSNVTRYTTIIIPPTAGTFRISDSGREKLKAWVQNGGVLIGLENTLQWLNNNGLGKFEMKKSSAKKDSISVRPYNLIEVYSGAQQTSGAIFQATADLTHPLLFGYYNPTMAVIKTNNVFMEKAKNAYGNPLVFTAAPLLSGYISKENYEKLKNSSIVGVSVMGQGRIIGITDNISFRAFWFGTNKILMNAIFYGSFVNAAASR